MAVAEMSKLNLAAMSYAKDAVLNALQRTGAVEIKMHYEAESTVALSADCESIRARLAVAENALQRLCTATDAYVRENKIKTDVLDDGFEVTYSQFMAARLFKSDMDALVEKINSLFDEDKSYGAQLSKVNRSLEEARIYSTIKTPVNVTGTARVSFALGTIPYAAKEKLFHFFEEDSLCKFKQLAAEGDEILVFAAYHKSVAGETEKALQECSFNAYPFEGGLSGEEVYARLSDERDELLRKIKAVKDNTYLLCGRIRDLKTYCDYVAYELEKAELSDKMRATQTTFLLEAYVPTERKAEISNALESADTAVYYEFSAPSENEIPPTLLKNNKAVKNFEAVTNMYSPVSYKEFDPNTVMAFFYSVFLGFIMGDVGYGLLMIVFGGFVYFKIKRDTGMKRLSGVFAIGGIFAVIWGLLFNSLFGMPIGSMPTVMPDAQTDMWLLMGIKIPSVLIISLLIGLIQLCCGYICRAVQCWRRKQIVDGIFDGLVWALFTVGVGLALIGLVDDFNAPLLAYAGGIIAAVTLVTAMLTAGRKEKILGKFTKGFGAAYGVINFASDVLSYARLYGLMLSGAVIAQIISQYSVDFFYSGNAGLIILGVVLMVVGHAFNLAIGLLGAYIHDARLQYVEFYGRFYEGEGELFSPLGSKHKYIYLNN